MEGTARVIVEQFATTGVAATVAIDTDLLTPPRYSDVTKKLVRELEIGPNESDVTVVMSDASCVWAIESDEPVIVKLKTGETQCRVRMILLAAEDETGAALPAQTVLLTGNGSTPAKVQVFALGKV